MQYKTSVYAISDIGLVRQNNEDFWQQLPEEQFFVLADGMGGHQAGEIASRETVQRLCFLFHMHFNARAHAIKAHDLPSTKELLVQMIQKVNKTIYQMGHDENQKLRGMGTTLCCVYFHQDGLIYAHVGDSRIYHFRKQKLTQITQDHSLLRELMDLGQINKQQEEQFAYKNIITKAIGSACCVDPSISSMTVEAGDMILMCTDGLSDLVKQDEIQQIMVDTPEQLIVQHLVAKAKERGGHDNITVVLIKVE